MFGFALNLFAAKTTYMHSAPNEIRKEEISNQCYNYMNSDRKLAAAFIDFENFYYSLTNLNELPYEDAGELAVSMIAFHLDKLKENYGEFIIRKAFADWGYLQYPKKELQKLGIRIEDVLSTEYKNSADIELSLSVQETIITRDDIGTIVIFAGDRDYMPIANRARERGRNLHFVGFEKSLSGDLKHLVGDSNYSYASPEDLPSYNRQSLADQDDEIDKSHLSLEGLTAEQLKAAKAAIESFDRYKERFGSVKVSVFLVEGLAKALPELEHFDRKSVFSSLVKLNLLKTERRDPEYPDPFGNLLYFTVFTVNEDNPIIKSLRKHRKESHREAATLLKDAVRQSSNRDGTVLGAKLGVKLRELEPDFVPAKYGFADLAELIDYYPDILIYEGEKSGEDKKYRITLK